MAVLRIKFESDAGEVAERMRRWGTDDVLRRREEFVRGATEFAVNQAVERTPVREARARGSWVKSLVELGGVPPADWEGSHPNAAAVIEGEESGDVTHSSQSTLTEYRVTSRVRYINYLEYGTRKMDPFAMVRESLAATAEMVRWWDFLAEL
ncbi:MAG: hypothetical protein U0903_18085 [Planctomycetales bacterium]